MLRKSAHAKLAERVGVFGAIVENPNEYERFQPNARNLNDLAYSSFCQRLRPLASVCRFFHRDGTRHGTRRSDPN
jgi:hypothetical protein